MKLLLQTLLIISCSTICCKSSTTDGSVSEIAIDHKILVGNLSHPWEILWGPDNFIWMTERGGRISRVNPANGTVIPLLTIEEVESNGEGGLLGMVLHPNFSSAPHVFVAYNYDGSDGYKEKIVRFTYNGSTLVSPVTIIDHIDASGIHNGCRLAISADLKLFITTGDASRQSQPQNKNSVNGKVLRLNLDGSIPGNNPIAGNPVWSWGHRNAQGLVFDRGTLFSSEHGPDSDDEINIIEKGRNYGWPDVKGFCDGGSEQRFCTTENVRQPLKAWTPTAAVCGMDYYNNDRILIWKNSLLVTALKNSRLYQLKLNTDRTSITESHEFLNNEYGRLRDVCISPDGKVYVSTSNGSNDKIVVISK